MTPFFRTTDDWKVPVMMAGPESEAGDESIAVQRGADRLCVEPKDARGSDQTADYVFGDYVYIVKEKQHVNSCTEITPPPLFG